MVFACAARILDKRITHFASISINNAFWLSSRFLMDSFFALKWMNIITISFCYPIENID